jgi:hypothetical protein
MFGETNDNEDVTGKKGIQGIPQPARVSNGAPQSRNETSEAQPIEIELRPVLLMSERSRDEPALAWALIPGLPEQAYPLRQLRPFRLCNLYHDALACFIRGVQDCHCKPK